MHTKYMIVFLLHRPNFLAVSYRIQYGEAKLTPFMYIKGVNFASPYCSLKNKIVLLISVLDFKKSTYAQCTW